MRVLLTGGSGFLGKHVLKLLTGDERISKVILVTRSNHQFTHPKIENIKMDLAEARIIRKKNLQCNAILHLAGHYDFNATFADCYVNNVVSTSNIIAWLKHNDSSIPLHYASTYAISSENWDSDAAEDPATRLPGRGRPYPSTKALAEQVVLGSDVPAIVYRLGVLVGDSKKGKIEKIDGPYYILKLLFSLASLTPKKLRIPVIPFLADSSAFLPLVPVDCAARVMVEGLFRHRSQSNTIPIYGVYNNRSIIVKDFFEEVLENLQLKSRPFFVSKIPDLALKLQKHITGIPEGLFEFSTNVPQLNNKNFEKVFSDIAIPAFSNYKKAFFTGFKKYK